MYYKKVRAVIQNFLAVFSSTPSGKTIFILFLILLFIALPLAIVIFQRKYPSKEFASASGNLFYISKNGSNADGLSWATAWNDLNQIKWSIVNPGDTIVIDGGPTACPSNYNFVSARPGMNCGMLYNSSLTVGKSGTATAPITIKLATETGHDGTAVFFGGRATLLPYCTQSPATYSLQVIGSTPTNAVVIGGYQYIVLDGMKRSGIMIYGYEHTAVTFTSSAAGTITMRNMEIFDNGDIKTRSDGTYITDGKGIGPIGNNLTFERLLVHDNGQDEFQSGGPLANITIQDSWLYARRENPKYPGFGFNSGPSSVGCTHEDGIQVYGGGAQSGLTFKNDIFGPLLGQGIYPSDSGTYFSNVNINNVSSTR